MKKKAVKRKGRPSKKDTLDLAQLERLATLGLTDDQIGFVYGVAGNTIDNWKKDTNFKAVLQKGKDVADAMVERSLFERACGYSHPEDKIFCNNKGVVTVQETIKHYPPDTTACIFWLKNRKVEEWREKVEKPEESDLEEELEFTDAQKVSNGRFKRFYEN